MLKICTCLFIFVSLLCSVQVIADEIKTRTVKIGATLPLTGPLAHIGVDIRKGMELALSEIKDSPVSFQAIYEDNQHETKNAVSSAHKLLDVDQVDFLITLWDMADVVAPLAERKKVPHLSIRWNPHVAEKYKYTVTLESTYITYVKSQIELLKALDAKTIGLITGETQGWTLAAEELKKRAPNSGLKVVSDQTFIDQNPNFLTIVTKLLASNPDVVVINAHQPALDLILKRIRERRPKQMVTGYFEAAEPPSLVKGFPFVAQFEVAPWFVDRFVAKYGENFKVRAPHGYDLINLITSIYRGREGKTSGETFIQEIMKVKNFKGATGMLSINKTKNIESECVWQVVRDNKFIPLSPELLAKYRLNKGD